MSNSKKGLFLLDLTMENVKCFQKAMIDFREQGVDREQNKPARWTVILGENGTGKTTVLRTIVSMLPNPMVAENVKNVKMAFPFGNKGLSWAPERFGVFSSDIQILYAVTSRPFGNKKNDGRWIDWREHSKSTEFMNVDYANEIRHGELLFLSDDERVFICGYGASRKMVSKEGKMDSFLEDASVTLVDDSANLTHPAAVLKEIELLAAKHPPFVTLRDRLHEILLRVLPGISDFKFEFNENVLGPAKVVFHTADGWVALDDLSLGYKTTIAWVVDFAFKLGVFYKDSPDPLSEPAICLVDEIDLHMHPAWQRTIMKELSGKFPNTQFVVTAHSPLIVQAAAESNANIVVLRRGENNQVEVINDPIDVRHWRVDQILSSDLFGNLTPRVDSDEELAEERWQLLGKGNLTEDERKRIEEIESILSPFESQAEMDAQKLFKKLARELKEIQDRERK